MIKSVQAVKSRCLSHNVDQHHHPLNVTSMDSATLIKSAKHVLKTEGQALQALADTLDDNFVRAVHLLVACKGRVIVSGMGKSGHIGRKIAATLASTGTPAHFVHPGEASHGDLGMIMPQDVVVAISNSGAVAELTDLITYTRRFAIALIAITSRKDSPLAQAADIVLAMPPEPEVCPMGLAPTTSTTMTLGLGDALAVCALECKGFTADDYRNFHPGGKLGRKLLHVSDIMHGAAELPLAEEHDKMSHVMVVMTERSFGCAGVLNATGALVGIVTDGDLRRHMDAGLMQKLASEVMTPHPLTVRPDMVAAEALKILNDMKRTQLFVVADNKPVGILHIHDLLRAGVA